MRKNVSIGCLLFAWLCANGALWDAVQVVAWGKMFADYSKVMPVPQAIALTFDGSLPCDLCVVAQTGQDETREQNSSAALGGGDRLVLALEDSPAAALRAPSTDWPGSSALMGPERTDGVPAQPPRV